VRHDPRDLLGRLVLTIGLLMSTFTVALLIIVIGADYQP
jgi:hypothetical protein